MPETTTKKKRETSCSGCRRHKREIATLHRTIVRLSKMLDTQDVTIKEMRKAFADQDERIQAIEKLYRDR